MMLQIIFSVEPADRSVGIMAEGFAAWEKDTRVWCEWCEPGTMRWYDIDSSPCAAPANGKLIEASLDAFVRAYCEPTDN